MMSSAECVPIAVPSVTSRLRSRIRKKARKPVDEEVTNLAEHLAKLKLFEISNEAEDDNALKTPKAIREPCNTRGNTRDNPRDQQQASSLPTGSLVVSKTPRSHEKRYLSPLQSRKSSTRRVNVINYSQASMVTKLKEMNMTKSQLLSDGQKQMLFQPVRNFTNFILLDNREVNTQGRDALPQPKVNKSLYKSTFFRMRREEKPLDPVSAVELPRPQDMLAHKYKPTRVVIHSIYGELRNETACLTARKHLQRLQPSQLF